LDELVAAFSVEAEAQLDTQLVQKALDVL
jgi:hypothetical protein